ncbi:plasmid recombination protein [Paracoccus denitrificans]|uniref:plasmid recombination protein n=1 Tax=Paracoccus denitrificans TaxID=266 RepID=UPI001E2A167D|nr:plasmid recombination protein [Paracoccus denitrificans]UFS64701.1 plasmid recombination protein [Paracoccus denitrificans]
MAKPPQNHKTPEGNPKAASTRLELKNARSLAGQRKHDLRIGRQPDYVDESRKELNRTLIEPDPPSIMRAICETRRSLRDTRRKMKKDASVAACGIITFGAEAADLFESLTPEAQDAAFLDLAESVADRLNTTLHGLVVHMDETTIHAHFQLAAYNRDGLPLSQATRPAVMSGLQDLTAQVMARHCAGIERGHRYGDRIAAGADFRETLHRTVRELHRDLPRELAAKQADIAKLDAAKQEAQARVYEMQARVDKLTEKAELSEKEAKRLETYEKRLADRVAELEAAEQAAEFATAEEQRLAAIARAEAGEAEKRAAQADEDARRVSEKAGALLTATAALTGEMAAGTLRRTGPNSVRTANPAVYRPAMPDIASMLGAATDAAEARRREEAAAETARRQRLEDEAKAEAARTEAAALLADARRERDEAGKVWEEVRRLRAKLTKALGLVSGWLKSPNLTREARRRGEALQKVIDEDQDLTPAKPNDSGEGFAM